MIIYQKFIKRPLDVFFSLIALIILSPVLLILALLVRQKLGKPIFFKQKRPGKNEKIFDLFKFRTMTDQRDEHGKLLPDEFRLTSFGKWLRSTSLDELPELWNIFIGDMSFVGPRPLLIQYLPLYNDRQRRRHEVLPGLTGLAQVNGRNAIDWKTKFEYDIQYVDNVSFAQDLQILFKTFVIVFRKEGITSKTSETTEYFSGNDPDVVEKEQ